MHRDLIKYFHPKSSPVAPVMLPSSTGVMTVFAHTAFLCIDWARGVLVLLLLPRGGWEVHEWPAGTLSQKSTSPDFLLPSPAPEATVSPYLAGDNTQQWETDTHVLTSNWKKYWDVFGFLGSSWKTKTGQGHFMSGIICKNHPGLSQVNCSKVESLLYFQLEICLDGPFSAPIYRLALMFRMTTGTCCVLISLWSHCLIYQRKFQLFPEAVEL